ncbi:TetR/AcrR family transcriptional regulator [Diplocloster agilis]|uniref:TetR/AcrR family transcriptional regulator n=1 Tax=Diplocloster agilis TaxID=2850323 RepID=A0A949K3T9_9FIRM|nr:MULTISPECIES: TetR/AcrR family transcriptional regulator [Lachnospiraceae]MBU9734908.1 TetR/AcrR family transcriptional regulator [Diplocloster agilis]MCU6733632.1 TetR/AcrR family transcriptional regulator [Suonthocola fibrivorans]SCJ00729.1 HTH-type transcriptional regulator EthR [uncultured Clostridium sp.]
MAAPRKENVKELILDSAESLLENKKTTDISLAEIARTAGVSKGTLYYHYKNKNEVFLDLTNRYLEEQWNNLIAWTTDESKDTSLHRLVKYVLERDISTVRMRLHFFYDAMMGNEEIRQKLLSWYSRFAGLIGEKIGERTQIIDPEYLSWLILLLSDGLFIHQTLQNSNLDTETFITQTSEYMKLLNKHPAPSPKAPPEPK